MKYRLPLIFLLASASVACTTTSYQSPTATREDVADVRARTEAVTPQRQALTLAEAAALAKPIFSSIADDAGRICRTVAEADSCLKPEFEVVDLDTVNARAGYTLQNEPRISLTRGLVEQLADQPDELALVIGHEYAHLISAHVEDNKPDTGGGGSTMTALLSAVAAAGIAVASEGHVRYQPTFGSAYSQKEIDEYLADSADPHGAYTWFSKSEELEADYIGTYLATRSGYSPTVEAFLEIGALQARDKLSALDKQDRKLSYAYWDTHPYSPDRAARFQETLAEIEQLKAQGFARPLPPRLILELQDNNAAFHSLEELIAPLP